MQTQPRLQLRYLMKLTSILFRSHSDSRERRCIRSSPCRATALAFKILPSSYQPITGRQRAELVRAKHGRSGKPGRRPVHVGLWHGHESSQRVRSSLGGLRQTLRDAIHRHSPPAMLMEAALGSLWGEDPRYFRADGQSFKGRMKNVIVMTFVARQADGTLAPAYARYIGNRATTSFRIPGGRTANPAWATPACALLLGFAGTNGQQCLCRVLARRPQIHLSQEALILGP